MFNNYIFISNYYIIIILYNYNNKQNSGVPVNYQQPQMVPQYGPPHQYLPISPELSPYQPYLWPAQQPGTYPHVQFAPHLMPLPSQAANQQPIQVNCMNKIIRSLNKLNFFDFVCIFCLYLLLLYRTLLVSCIKAICIGF